MRPTGRARVSSSRPEAFGVCDRCGIWYNQNRLQWQYEWGGNRLYNKQLLFCPACLDVPQQQLRTIILPPDPLPITNARTEPFSSDNSAGPVSSQIAQDAQLGDTTVYVQSVAGFTVGMAVNVQLNNGTFAAVNITAIDTGSNALTISIPLPYAASTLGIVSQSIS